MNNISHILKLFLISLVCMLALSAVVYAVAWSMFSMLGFELAASIVCLVWAASIMTIYLRGEGY